MSTGWSPYQEWFPYFQAHILPQFEDQCRDLMNAPHTVDSYCQNAAVCIFNNINSYTQAQLSGAAVMLGLAPSMLALLGPMEKSLAFLSSERPILSLLLASSTATLSVPYPFSRVSPLQPLADAINSPWSVDRLLPYDLMGRAWLVSPLQYVLSMAATANTIQLSYDITRKTVVSWSCPNWAWVLGWSFSPLFIHLISMAAFRLAVKRGRPRQELEPAPGAKTDARTQKSVQSWSLPRDLYDFEFRPCSARVLPEYTTDYSLVNQILWWIPPLLSYLQYLLGTAIFSSLMFVPISDVFPIVVRYGISAVVARCIVGLELHSLKRNNNALDLTGLMSPQFDSPFQEDSKHIIAGKVQVRGKVTR